METFTITFKTAQYAKTLRANVKAENLKEAVQKLKTLHQDALIVSYLQK